jgi:glycosyltransferase involved in cell wall biosynthesis
MTVALVTNYLPPYRLPLYELLAERFDVEVFCFGGEAHYVPAALRDLDAQIAAARFPAHRLERQRDAASVADSHEAVIASTAGRVALPAAYRGARRRERPFVLWASLWRHPRTPAHALSWPMMRRLYRRADAVLTYGPHVSEYVAGQRGSDDGVFVAPQAVEPELFGRTVEPGEVAALRHELDVPVGRIVLYAGRLVEDKGVRVLLDAWGRVGDGDATLCLVGDGPLTDGNELRGAERVRLAGRLERERLPVAYAAADVVVVPSVATRRFLEPWGLVCNEAMHQGRPLIATDAVGAAAGGLVRDGETGAVVPAGDPAALAEAIERLLADAPLRSRLGESARELVSDFSYARAADAFGQALDTALARTPGRLRRAPKVR